jgi:hypothetical protein
MTIKNLIELFLDGEENGYTGTKSSPGNLKIVKDKLFHYDTVIAERANDTIYVNLSQYSIQTGNVQKQLKAALVGKEFIAVKKVPRDYKGSLVAYEKKDLIIPSKQS